MNTRDVRRPWRRRIKRASRRVARTLYGGNKPYRRALREWMRAWDAWLLSYDGA